MQLRADENGKFVGWCILPQSTSAAILFLDERWRELDRDLRLISPNIGYDSQEATDAEWFRQLAGTDCQDEIERIEATE